MLLALRRIAISLLIGAIVAFVVAWGGVVLGAPSDSVPLEKAAAIDFARQCGLYSQSDATFTGRGREAGSETRRFVHVMWRDDAGTPRSATVRVFEQGWPFRMLRGEHRFGGAVDDPGLRSAFLLPRAIFGEDRILTYHPHGTAFIAGAALYGAPIWLIAFGPRTMRWFWRRRRGRCPACGYDLRGDLAGGCPECGWARGGPEPEEGRAEP